jgi:hypothetical protein
MLFCMADHAPRRGEFSHLPGVDLYLWLRLVLAVLTAVLLGVVLLR